MRDLFSRIILGAMCAAAVWATGGVFVVVPANGADQPAMADARDEQIAALVKQLGDDDCKAREAASAELSKIGLAAKDALAGVLDHPDLEVRIRAKQLLTTILADDFERRLNEFAEDVDDQKGLDLPCWKRYKQEYGNKGEARKLFVAMQRAEHGLLNASAQGARQAAAAVTERYNAAQSGVLFGTSGNRRTLSLETMATLVFAATDPDVQLSDGAAGWLATMTRQNPFSQAVAASSNDGVPRQMVIRWIEHPLAAKAANVAEMNLAAAVQYNLTEALTPALEILDLNTSQPFYKQKAILIVGKRGGKEHLPVLAPFLKDEARCGIVGLGRVNGIPGAEIQVRDVALAAMIHLSGQDPKDFGFEHLLLNEQMLYQSQTVGFDDAAKRDAAFKKWAERSAMPTK